MGKKNPLVAGILLPGLSVCHGDPLTCSTSPNELRQCHHHQFQPGRKRQETTLILHTRLLNGRLRAAAKSPNKGQPPEDDHRHHRDNFDNGAN